MKGLVRSWRRVKILTLRRLCEKKPLNQGGTKQWCLFLDVLRQCCVSRGEFSVKRGSGAAPSDGLFAFQHLTPWCSCPVTCEKLTSDTDFGTDLNVKVHCGKCGSAQHLSSVRFIYLTMLACSFFFLSRITFIICQKQDKKIMECSWNDVCAMYSIKL